MPAYIKGSPSHWAGDMTHTAVFYAASTLDNYGKRTIAGSGTSFPCHIQFSKSSSRDEQGQQVIEGGKLYIMSDANISINDRLDLPDTNIDPRITDIKKVKYMANGSSAVHHTVVSFGALGG